MQEINVDISKDLLLLSWILDNKIYPELEMDDDWRRAYTKGWRGKSSSFFLLVVQFALLLLLL